MSDTAKPDSTAHETDIPCRPASDESGTPHPQTDISDVPVKSTFHHDYFMIDADLAQQTFIPVYFPGYGELDITYESSLEREVLGLRPAPVIRPRGEDFSPTDLIIKDEVGNLYEVVLRRKTKFNRPLRGLTEPMDLTEDEKAAFLNAGRELGHIKDDVAASARKIVEQDEELLHRLEPTD
jgi:hypothetical protein